MTGVEGPAIPSNVAGAISYFTFVPACVLLLAPRYKESPCIRFHAWQSILLCMAAFGLDIVLGSMALLIPSLNTGGLAYSFRILSLVWVVLWVACVITAFRGKRLKLPLLGRLAEKLSAK